jgi:hypothetical protein
MPFNITSERGPSGQSFILKGNYATLQLFNAGAGASTGTPGDCWLIESDGSLMVYSTLEGWIDAGDIIGPQGIQGAPGPKGDTGLTGPKGDTGAKGDTGLQGIQGIKGDTGERGLQGIQGNAGVDGNPLDFLNVASNIVPSQTNYYTLGTQTKRWADVYLGPNTINVIDQTLLTNATIGINNGTFFINGIAQAQLPNVKVTNLIFADNHTQRHSSDILLISHQDGNQTPFETVDLTKQILVMSDGTWTLPDGAEGQIMYFVQGNGGSAEDSYLNVAHLKYNNNGLATQMNNGVWSPFNYESGHAQSPMCTAIFTDGYWSFSNGRKR